MQEEFSDFIRFLANRAYRLISICPVALNILFDLIQSSGADALDGVCVLHNMSSSVA